MHKYIMRHKNDRIKALVKARVARRSLQMGKANKHCIIIESAGNFRG